MNFIIDHFFLKESLHLKKYCIMVYTRATKKNQEAQGSKLKHIRITQKAAPITQNPKKFKLP
jgi:hypothetical protein